MPTRKCGCKHKNRSTYTAVDLAIGTAQEQQEHHLGRRLSRKIARDHLESDPNYYRRRGRDALVNAWLAGLAGGAWR